MARARRIFLCTSRILLDEFADVLIREKHAKKLAATSGGLAAILADYRRICSIVEPAPLPHSIAPDPDDDWVIATAIAAKVDLIVTGDKPLLSVGQVEGISIVTVAEAIALLEGG